MRSTKVFIGSLTCGQKTERARLEAEVDRAQRVLDGIDAACAAAPTDGLTTGTGI